MFADPFIGIVDCNDNDNAQYKWFKVKEILKDNHGNQNENGIDGFPMQKYRRYIDDQILG
jgi:hypothetical protein